MTQARYTLGSVMPRHMREEAKSRFVHRFTGQHVPRWASTPRPNGEIYPVHFADDDDWLSHTFFATNKDCTDFDQRVTSCCSYPTWPNNPELRNDAFLNRLQGRY